MQIYLKTEGSTLIAVLSGEIDHHNSEKVRKEIDNALCDKNIKNIAFDFKDISFMDSSGIGVIMGRYNKVKERGGSIAICGCSDYMREILAMAGIFTIVREENDISSCIIFLNDTEKRDMEFPYSTEERKWTDL